MGIASYSLLKTAISFQTLAMTLEAAVILLLFGAALFTGVRYGRMHEPDLSQFFVANRRLPWGVIGLSLLGADSMQRFAIWSAGEGIARFAFVEAECVGILILVFLAGVLYRRYEGAGALTLPGLFGKEYGRGVQTSVAGFSVAISFILRTLLTLVCSSMALARVTSLDVPTILVVLVMIAGVSVTLGGFRPAAYIQTAGAVVIVAAALALLFMGILQNPDAAGPAALLPQAGAVPWAGLLIGLPILVLWYWGMDHYMVQHIVASRSEEEMRKSARLIAGLKAAMLLPVVAGGALLPDVAGSGPYARLLILALILAATTAALVGIVSSASSLVALDLYRPSRPETSARKLILVTRLFITGMVAVVLLYIPLVRIMHERAGAVLLGAGILVASPLAAVHCVGLLHRKANSVLLQCGLIAGECVAAVKIAIDVSAPMNWEPEGLFVWVQSVGPLDFSVVLIVIVAAVVALGGLPHPLAAPKAPATGDL